MFRMASPTQQPLISKMYKFLSKCMLRNSLNVQIPLTKKNVLLNSFFWKAASLGNALHVVVKSSDSFMSFKLHLETFFCGSKRNCLHLHGSIPSSTSLRCKLHLSHSVLNMNKCTYRLCSYGSKETEEYLLLNCTLHSALRVDLVQSVIFLKGQFYWKVRKIHCQVCFTIIQDCCNFYYFDILRLLNLYPPLSNAVSRYLECTNRFTSP